MKKNSKQKKVNFEDIDAEIKQLSDEMSQLEYHTEIENEEMLRLKSEYMNVLILIDRTVFSEEERRELEKKTRTTWEKIARVDKKLQDQREKVAHNRSRLERVKTVREERKSNRK